MSNNALKGAGLGGTIMAQFGLLEMNLLICNLSKDTNRSSNLESDRWRQNSAANISGESPLQTSV